MVSETAQRIQIHPIRTPELGNNTYAVSHNGVGLLVDPQRDIDRFMEHFDQLDIELRWVAETHIHNDYVSGGLQVALRTGAELLIPSGADPSFSHTPIAHHQELSHGGLTITALHTPGHTPEHTSYLLHLHGQPVALFSGGSLLVGSAGRSDLLGPDHTVELARSQFRSVTELSKLPSTVGLYPTHGAGSFCTVSEAGKATSTIGDEILANPALSHRDEESFLASQLSGLQPFPSYYAFMAAANRAGGGPMPSTHVPTIEPGALAARSAEFTIIDVRDRYRFAEGHIPGSLGIELGQDFTSWAGWLAPPDKPIALVARRDQDVSDAVVQMARIGRDDIEFVLDGLEGWRSEGQPVSSFRTVGIDEFRAAMAENRTIVDVRSPGEYEAGHVEGSVHSYVPDLANARFDTSMTEAWVGCRSGYRANIAAGILESRGITPVVLARGGIPDVVGH